MTNLELIKIILTKSEFTDNVDEMVKRLIDIREAAGLLKTREENIYYFKCANNE